VAKTPDGFVSLQSLKPGSPQASPLAELRRIYFKTTRQTIENDFVHAIELLKQLPSEEERQKAHVYMEGLAEMAREWEKGTGDRKQVAGGKGARGKGARGKSTR
jgi:hypothetical protein